MQKARDIDRAKDYLIKNKNKEDRYKESMEKYKVDVIRQIDR